MTNIRSFPMNKAWWSILIMAALGACAAHSEEPVSPSAPAPYAPAASLAMAPSASPPPSSLATQTPTATPLAPPSASAPAATEQTTAQKARAVFNQQCASCHIEGTNAKATKHFKLDHDVLAGHHVGSLGKTMRQVLGMNGGKATMPPGGHALSPEDAQLLVSWADEQDRSAPKQHEGHTH